MPIEGGGGHGCTGPVDQPLLLSKESSYEYVGSLRCTRKYASIIIYTNRYSQVMKQHQEFRS